MKAYEILTHAARPRLKMFLSADIVGSTAYKQKVSASSAHSTKWPSNIQSFYNRMAESFVSRWGELKAAAEFGECQDRLFGSAPRVWKTVGDEILFWKEITSEDQVWMVLRAWFDAVAKVRRWLHGDDGHGSENTGLDIKCTAWCAGFPFRNRAIVNTASGYTTDHIPDIEDATLQALFDGAAGILITPATLLEKFYRSEEPNVCDSLIDFIGPGIDVGFRLSSQSSTRRMMLSVDLVYLMALSMREGGAGQGMQFPPFGGEGGEKYVIPDCQDIGRRHRINYVKDSNFSHAAFDTFGIHYERSEQLKGVAGGREYPLFWINVEKIASLDSMKSELLEGRVAPQSWQSLLAYCQQYYMDRSDYAFAPFIGVIAEVSDDRKIFTRTALPAGFDYRESWMTVMEEMTLNVEIDV